MIASSFSFLFVKGRCPMDGGPAFCNKKTPLRTEKHKEITLDGSSNHDAVKGYFIKLLGSIYG